MVPKRRLERARSHGTDEFTASVRDKTDLSNIVRPVRFGRKGKNSEQVACVIGVEVPSPSHARQVPVIDFRCRNRSLRLRTILLPRPADQASSFDQ